MIPSSKRQSSFWQNSTVFIVQNDEFGQSRDGLVLFLTKNVPRLVVYVNLLYEIMDFLYDCCCFLSKKAGLLYENQTYSTKTKVYSTNTN